MTFRNLVIAGLLVAGAGPLSACVYEPAPAPYYPAPGPAYYYTPGPGAYYGPPPAYGSVGIVFGNGYHRHWR